ncbi:MAG: DUF3761 domain-containing protein [Gemmatimonadaceae bacterium]|nr:DUF3761 domain-containing protein [Gemmatimonadaceae bacterium]
MRMTLLRSLALVLLAMPLAAQAPATVCKDGSGSVASGRGACSGHGGVDEKATASAARAMKAQKKATAKAAKAAARDAKEAAKDAAKATEKAAKVATNNAKDATMDAAKATREAAKATKNAARDARADAGKAAAMVSCADGSRSSGDRGACSGHGGIRVAGQVTPAPRPAPSLPAAVPRGSPARTRSRAKSSAPEAASNRGEDNDPRGSIAQCKDGMYSHAANRQGACSRHNGVAKWMQ